MALIVGKFANKLRSSMRSLKKRKAIGKKPFVDNELDKLEYWGICDLISAAFASIGLLQAR